MADFVKYNGYNVKDANALAHASISGKTLTTTDRKGRTVDSLELPGGEFSSPMYKKYDPQNMTDALATIVTEDDIGNEVRSMEFWGYTTSTVVDWDPDHPAIQVGDTIYADTLHAWKNYATSNDQYGVSSYQTAYQRQIRPTTYKTNAFFTRTEGFNIAAGSRYEVIHLSSSGYMTVKAPDGRTIGYAVPVSAEIIGDQYAFSAIAKILYGTTTQSVFVYNPSTANIYIRGVKITFDVVLIDDFTTKFLQNENVNTPFIEGVYTSIATDSATNTRTVETKVIVKNKSANTNYTLDEYELEQVDGAWSWVKKSTQAIPTTSVMTYYNQEYTFKYPLGPRSGDTSKKYSGAVWYSVSLSDLSIDTSDVVLLPRRRAVS